MKLEEIFNHTEPLEWQTTGRFEMAAFDLNGGHFQIQIERVQFIGEPMDEFKGKKLGIISFYRRDIDNSDAAHSTTKQSGKGTVKIYGAVANGLASKFDDYDAFGFEVEKRHSDSEEEYETKRGIYLAMARVVKSRNGIWYYERTYHGGLQILISKIRLSDETSSKTKFVNPVKEALLACGFDSPYARGL